MNTRLMTYRTFKPAIAKICGVNAAIVFDYIESCNKNGATPTRKEIEESLSFFSWKQVYTALSKLESANLLESEQPHLQDFDVTKFYKVK